MSEKITERIALLLNKAESTTPEEAEALTAAAEKLMLKYGIEQAKISAKRAQAGQPDEKIVTETITFNGAYRLEYMRMGAAVCASLGALRNMQNPYKNKSVTLYIIGYESDVKQAKTLIESLVIQSMVAVRTWWRDHKAEHSFKSSYDQEATRRSFVHGFGLGAAKRIRENKNQVVQEAGTGTELVLVSRDNAVQAAFNAMSSSKSRSRGGKGSSSALGDGIQAGRNANTGEKSINNRKALA